MIQAGDKVPDVRLQRIASQGAGQIGTAELFLDKKAVLVGVPGAFTPVCSEKHLPGFLEHAEDLRAKGVDLIVCLSVNDTHVMNAWAKDQNVGDKILMLADGSGRFTKALGMDIDIDDMGLCYKRFAVTIARAW